MTKEDCDYCIDKAIAAGMLDSDGGLNFVIKGSREEIIQGILERAAIWGIPMGRAEAERLTDKAIGTGAAGIIVAPVDHAGRPLVDDHKPISCEAHRRPFPPRGTTAMSMKASQREVKPQTQVEEQDEPYRGAPAPAATTG